jgi:hypothetical protein
MKKLNRKEERGELSNKTRNKKRLMKNKKSFLANDYFLYEYNI